MEVWKKAVDAFAHVEVSSSARVRVKERIVLCVRNGISCTQRRPAKLLSPWVGNAGYLQVAVKVGTKRRKFFVHRLVGRAFVKGYKCGLTINHIDGNKLNNSIENLEWITLAENTRKQWETGLVNLRGENHPSHKLTDQQVKCIRQSNQKSSVLARLFQVSDSLVCRIRKGQKRVAVSALV
jgi:hypothetical protein